MNLNVSFLKPPGLHMESDVCFVLSHGWGFDATFWQPLKDVLHPAKVVCLDRGYFSQDTLEFSGGDMFSDGMIGIGHSVGLSHLIQTGWPFQALIGIQSLPIFSGSDLRRRQEAAIFLNHFRLSPLTTLKRFYARCGMPFHHEAKSIQADRLERDLLLLFSQEETPSCPTLLIAAEHDIVTPLSYFYRALKTSPYYHLQILPYTKHNLGYQKPLLLKNMIWRFLEQHGHAL